MKQNTALGGELFTLPGASIPAELFHSVWIDALCGTLMAELNKYRRPTMKKKLILATLLMSMAVTVFAEEEIVWEEQMATEDVAYAEIVFEEETEEEETISEEPEYVFEEPETAYEESTNEETVSEQIAFEENAVVSEEGSAFEADVVTEEVAGDETAAGDENATSSAVEGLVYTGEPQELITAQEGSWTYSLDGMTYTEEIPTGVNAGEYTVYMKEGDSAAVVITVTIAKADVIFTPPVANTTTNPSEAGESATGEEPAYSAEPANISKKSAYSGEEVIEEVF